MTAVNRAHLAVTATSDASGSWGCDALCGNHQFQLQWEGMGNTAQYGITTKELLPIPIAAVVRGWGWEWKGQTVLVRCDTMAVVVIVNSGSSREKESMHLRRAWPFWRQKEFSTSVQSILEGGAMELQMLCPGITCLRHHRQTRSQQSSRRQSWRCLWVSSRTDHHQIGQC